MRSADYHKTWELDAEPELRRIIRERDQRIAGLEARIRELTGATDTRTEEPAHVVAFGRKGTLR